MVNGPKTYQSLSKIVVSVLQMQSKHVEFLCNKNYNWRLLNFYLKKPVFIVFQNAEKKAHWRQFIYVMQWDIVRLQNNYTGNTSEMYISNDKEEINFESSERWKRHLKAILNIPDFQLL